MATLHEAGKVWEEEEVMSPCSLVNSLEMAGLVGDYTDCQGCILVTVFLHRYAKGSGNGFKRSQVAYLRTSHR